MIVRQRVCLLLYLFPVGFKTSRALQALTRNTKEAKQLVLHRNTSELQMENHVLGQVQYQDCFRVPPNNTAIAPACGLSDNSVAGGCRLLKRVLTGSIEKVSYFWHSFRLLLPNPRLIRVPPCSSPSSLTDSPSSLGAAEKSQSAFPEKNL